jgi:EAL domain-containing protein (putative c-di-GMP-specific phosphodiesterase class I)
VPPTEFVPIAEDAGLVGQMTERLLHRACAAARDWPADVTLAVNVSPVQLRDRQLPRMVQAALEQTGLPPGQLEIELTETALLADFALARSILDELKALGVRLSLDDFGTGYSSLRHLQMLPIDKIKIDSSFVRAMGADADSRKIVAAVVGLGHSLGLPTVAEGVEDVAAAMAVAELGCDIGQGYLFGKALPVAAATALARTSPAELQVAVGWSGTVVAPAGTSAVSVSLPAVA